MVGNKVVQLVNNVYTKVLPENKVQLARIPLERFTIKFMFTYQREPMFNVSRTTNKAYHPKKKMCGQN